MEIIKTKKLSALRPDLKFLTVVIRQQFVMGINCSIFLYQNSFGAKEHLALTRKSFRIVQVFTLCSSAGLAVGGCSAVMV